MPSRSMLRWAVYGVAAVATVSAMRWASGVDERAAPPSARGGGEQRSVPGDRDDAQDALPDVHLAGLNDRVPVSPKADPFAARSWDRIAREEETRRAPPRPVVKPPPPPPPQPPPVPFTYLGRMVDDGKTLVFLTRQDRNYVAREGEAIDEQYGVESIGEDHLVLTYRPLNARQTFAFGSVPQAAPRPGTAPSAPAPRPPARDEEEDDG